MREAPSPTRHSVPTDTKGIARAVNDRRLDPLDVVRFFIARVEERNPSLNAIVEFDPAVPLRDAGLVRERVRRGERLPLAGVPVVIKCCIDVAGLPVTQGCRALAERRPERDALVVERIREAGGVVLGLGNMSELGCKDITDNQLYGPTLHPFDRRLTPGGSSGGCAVAVAAGMAPLALGTDAGGSSRRPPAHVGIVGFKPTNGVIAEPYGYDSIVPGIDTLAPIGATVEDTRRLFEAIVGADAADPLSVDLPRRPVRDPRTLRVAYSPRLGLDATIDADIAAAVDAALAELTAAGLDIVQADPAWPADKDKAMVSALEAAGLAARWGETWKRDPSLFDPHVGGLIAAALSLTGIDVVRSRDASLAVWRSAQRFFGEFDLLLGPTLACVSWPVDRIFPEIIGGERVAPRGHAVFTPLFNSAQSPAITVPCGAGEGGLPVGLQVIGPRLADREVLAAASFIEATLGASARPWDALSRPPAA